MARTRSRGRGGSSLSWLLRALFLGTAGSGMGGYFMPDLPFIGPLVASLLGRGEVTADVGEIVDQVVGSVRTGNAPKASTSPQAPVGQLASTAVSRPASTLTPVSMRPSNTVTIATFNIQVFGESKMSKPAVVDVLAQTVRQFDLVAIQEIRAQADNIIPDFIDAINADGSRYDFLIGERIGRTVSTEQYAYVFDTSRIEYERGAVGTMADRNDLLHREPFVARFRARTQSPQNGFTFWLVNTHTDPDEVPEEVAALAEVYTVMQSARPDEDDVILLGDLNADHTQMGPLGQIPGIQAVVRPGVMTNTRKTKAYDNILFDSRRTGEYTGRWGVVDLEAAFGLTREQALDVSDHLPVWAEFSVWEANSVGQLSQLSRPENR